VTLAVEPLPVVEMLCGGDVPRERTAVSVTLTAPSADLGKPHPATFAGFFRDYLLEQPPDELPPARREEFRRQAETILANCRRPPDGDGAFAFLHLTSSLTPFLQPAELAQLWARLDHLPCAAGLEGPQQDWSVLEKAVGRRDAAAMADAAGRLLAHHEDRTPLRLRFLLQAGMLGNVAAGRYDQARALWQQYAARAFAQGPPPLSMRLLAAHAGVTG
jgi:hypothetical protein